MKLPLLITITLLFSATPFLLVRDRTTSKTAPKPVSVSNFGQLLSQATPTPTPSPTPTPLPQAVTLSGGSHTFQTFNNCGPAALSMSLSHYGINVSQQQLGQALRPYQNQIGDNDDKSVTLEEIALKADDYNLIPFHRPNGNINQLKQFVAVGIPVITRTWLNLGEDIGHYRVIKGYDDTTNNLIQDDSLQGTNLTFTYEHFSQLWEGFNYEFLALVTPDKLQIAQKILGDNLDERVAWQNALVTSNQAIALNPDNIPAQFNRSVALYRLGRFQESVQAFEQVEKSLPARMLWYQIDPILAYFELDQQDRVLSITQQIITGDNRAFSELYHLRGQIFQDQGNHQQANEEFANARIYNKNFNPQTIQTPVI